MPDDQISVFISYSHDSPPHEARVLEFANHLRADGVAAMIDQYQIAPPEGWQLWMEKQIRDAKFVLLVCTETYLRRVMKEDAGKGLGVMWESGMIYSFLYEAGVVNDRFIPVVFEHGDLQFIPRPLKPTTYYELSNDAGYDSLYRRFTAQPATQVPALGARRVLSPKTPIVSANSSSNAPAQSITPPVATVSAAPIQIASLNAADGKSMQEIAAGQFIFGAGEVRPASEFYIDTVPVTHEEFLRFVQATGARAPASWQRGKFPSEKSDHPVTGVSWHEAMAYATWAGKRLPTAPEWEKAARGTDGRRYPWGNDFDAKRCNTLENGLGGTTPVRQYPEGASPYGVLDLTGNVWEWTSDEIKARGLGRTATKRILKGGAWNVPQNSAECMDQISAMPEDQLEYVGFRCVR